MTYIHEKPRWPDLRWNHQKLDPLLATVRHLQGYLLGRMSTIGFDNQREANLETLATDIIKSSAIEGEILNSDEVRSSLAKRLGINIAGLPHASRHIDGIVEMMLDATQSYQSALTRNRLFAWHHALFPMGRSGLRKIKTAGWRTAAAGEMQVVSGPIGREKIHFIAPDSKRISHEMALFLKWFNHEKDVDPVLKAGIAHFWFVTIHPFEDGNGRIARAIGDMCLARADGMSNRFYSLSSSIERSRKEYYNALEFSQKGGLDITAWLEWFLNCLENALKNSDHLLEKVLLKTRIWQDLSHRAINERQRKIINLLLCDFQGELTTTKYAKIAKCSQDTALRDIQLLMEYGVLKQSKTGGRSTNYRLSVSFETINVKKSEFF